MIYRINKRKDNPIISHPVKTPLNIKTINISEHSKGNKNLHGVTVFMNTDAKTISK